MIRNPTVESLIDQYMKWLRSRVEIKEVEGTGFIEITTPFLDRDNDRIQLYVKTVEDKKIRLSDGGDTLSELELIGVDTQRGKRQQLIRTILLQNGVGLEGTEIYVITTYEHFPVAKNNLIRAILAINDLYFLAPKTAATAFKDDVEAFLEENEIRYSTGFGLIGRSGLYQPFHFLIQSKKADIVLHAIGKPTRQWISLVMMAWDDVSALRGAGTIAFGILNDTGISVEESLIFALKNYSIQPFLWSKKHTLLEALKA